MSWSFPGIAVNALWPRTAILTAAVTNLMEGVDARSRTPEIMADAAYAILTSNPKSCTGNFFIDDEVLASIGVTDFAKYSVDPSAPQSDLVPDFFIE